MANGNGIQYLPGGGESKVPQWCGIYLGSIAINADPLAQGRVKLRIPQVFGNTVSGWADPVVPLTYIPAVGTAVTAMFLGGDPAHPVWLGNFAVSGSAEVLSGDGPPASVLPGLNPPVGTIYFDLAPGTQTQNQMSEWNGVTWVAYQIGSDALSASLALETPDITGGTITGSSIVADGINGEFLVYAGSPAAGNLIASLSGGPGTDGHSNAYPAGLRLTGTTGGTITIDPTAGGGVPAIQLVPESATHVDIPPQVYAGGLNLGAANEVETLYLTSGQSQATANTNSALQLFSDAADGSAKSYANFILDGANTILRNLLGGYLPVTQVQTGTFTNANAGAQFMAGYTIPANDMQVGTIYEIDVPFNGVFENQTLGFKPYVGVTAVATSGGDTIGAGFFTSGTAFQGSIRLKMQVLTTGTAGTVNFFVDGGIGVNSGRSSGTNNNNAYLSSQATAVTLNTTIANTINLTSVWGGSTSGQTVTSRGSKLTRIGP